MLEHTSEPWRVLAEARRVLKPGGRAIIVVPNDVTMSAGRLVLGKFPIRYPDHLTFTTPGRMHRWLKNGFRVTEEFSAAVPAAAVRGESLLLHGRGGGVSAQKPKVVILGAGPAGISAAWRLTKLGYPVTVLERDGAVGGMGRTIKVGDYSVDFGPHTFHIRETPESKEILKTITPFFGEDPLTLVRGTRVLLRGKEYVYPLEMLQVLFGVNPLLSARFCSTTRMATLKSFFAPAKKEDSFEEWGVRNLGRTLYDLCFGIYSERVWGLPTSQISSKQAQRVAKLNLKNIILRTLGIKADPATYFTKYFYPRKGISLLYEGMAREVTAAGNTVLLNSPAVRVERTATRCRASIYQTDAGEQSIDCDILLSTLPLPALVNMMSPALPQPVIDHAARLRYRSLKLIYIALKRPQLTDYHWVYLLDDQLPRQPHVGAEERQSRHGAEGSHDPLHRAVAVEGRAAVEGER